MSLDWPTFKSALGRNLTVTYIDDENSEIPIDSECEFQEALRLARLNKQRLRIIVSDISQPSQKRYLSRDLPISRVEKSNFTKINEMMASSSVKEPDCRCNKDAPPEWFTHYMKKFKKELIHELKSYIHDAVHNTLEKEKKFTTTVKSETHDLVCEKSENFPVSKQIKKKKKLEKDSTDVIDQRGAKLPSKLVKLPTTKSERLEKLDNKMRILLEEKRRLSERKRHLRPKFDKTSMVGMSEKKSLKKSVFFRENNAFLFLSPGSEFTVKVDLINDGKLPWSDPRLECFDFVGLYSKESSLILPKLSPMESYSTTLKGKASETAGLHHLKCRVFDGTEPFGPEFTCWARVEMLEPVEKTATPATAEAVDSVGTLIDFDKDIIATSQKKIEENIIEIQRRLHDIDILRPATNTESNVKVGGSRVNGKGEKCKAGCDLVQDLMEKEKSWKERLEQEKVLFGIDCLRLDPSVTETCNLKTAEEKESDTESFEKIKNHSEQDHSSDSELSLIFMSEEEEENFIVIPSKSPSPAESVNENNKPLKKEDKAPRCNDQPKVKEMIKVDIKEETQTQKEEVRVLETRNPSPTRSRRSPFGEEIYKPKKIKSKSTEYHFTTENLTHPTFSQTPEGIFEGRSSRRPFTFMFTAGKEGKDKSEKKESRRKTDALGRVIYAVNSKGCCMPMEHVLGEEKRSKNPSEENEKEFYPRNQGRRSDRFNEIPAVNILPNALMSGASNVASLALNTAKSVLSNIQSAFVTDGKTEMGQSKESIDALFKLYEMGFSDLQLNRDLLQKCSNDLTRVVEELVRLETKQKAETPQ